MQKFLNRQGLLSTAVRVFKIFPPAYRFGAGKLTAKMLAKLPRRVSGVSPPDFALDTFDDYLCSAFFTSLTLRGIEFEPKFVLRAPRIEIPKGAILVSGHFFLNFFVFRWLHDQGFRQSFVLRDEAERHPILGTTKTIEVIKPAAGCLMEIRKRIKSGEVVSICVDHSEPFDNWQKLDIPERPIYISETIFKFAKRLEIPLVFVGTKVNAQDEIEIHTVIPVSTGADELTAEFTQFLKAMLTAEKK